MDFNEYQERATDTASYDGALTGNFDAIRYCALGCAGEGGEIAEKVKKMWRNHGELTPEDRTGILKELGDELWYLSMMATELGAKLEDIAVANIEKLADRKKRGVLKSEGDER